MELEESHASDRFTRPQLRYLLSRANGVTLVATEEQVVEQAVEDGVDYGPGRDLILGNIIVLFRRGIDAAHLYSLTVDPAHRNRGIGRLLLVLAEELAVAKGLGRMQLEVRSDNEAAIRLYRASGYSKVGGRPAYYADGCDALTMVKKFPIERRERA
ncbi:MAG: N-acetyltransferase [Trueperaceae bacterium]